MEKNKAQSFYTKYLSEEACSLKICFKIIAPLNARGNLRQSACSTAAAAGEAMEVWAVTVLTPFFYINTTAIQIFTEPYWQMSTCFYRLVLSWIVSLCPRKQNKDQWT